jgi:hypothetical protein
MPASPHPMAALQKVAMGLVIVLVDPIIGGYDALPDVLGWALALGGLTGLRGRITTSALIPLAVLAGLVSVPGIRPSVFEGLPESTGWALSLPQIVFSYLLCSALAQHVAAPLDGRLRVLRWVFVVVGLGPVLVYGGGVDALLAPLALLAVGAGLYLVYLLFRASLELAASDVPPRAGSTDETSGA